MNRPASSSSKPTKTHIDKSSNYRHQCSRNPLKDLNTTTVASTSSTSSSSSSIEAPRGCLRFLLSHSSSSNSKPTSLNRATKGNAFTKTPKSAPNPTKVKKNGACLYQWQSGRKPSSRNVSRVKKFSSLESGSSGSVIKPPSGRVVDDHFTPSKVVDRIVSGDDKEEKMSNTSGNKSRTPPIQASLSPEIQAQCAGLSFEAKSATPCYAAGYIVSGVTDKRKCRPRGILTVGEENLLDFDMNKAIDSFREDGDGDEDGMDKENVIGVVDSSDDNLNVPLPAEASMHWLSPCNEVDEDHKEDSEYGSSGFRFRSPPSSLFGDGSTSDLSDDRDDQSARRMSISLLSPTEFSEFQLPLGSLHEAMVTAASPSCTTSCKVAALEENGKQECDPDGEKSPFSMDTLGSGNVIQTPQSDSSTGKCIGISQLETVSNQKHCFDSELDLVAECLQTTSLSSRGYESIWGPTSSSFQFDYLTTPSNSFDLSHFQKLLDDRASWMSTSTLDDVSQSQIRISWREGLASRIFEMDEFDSCRYLSEDDDEDVKGCHTNDQSKSCHNAELHSNMGNGEILKNDSRTIDFEHTEMETEEKGETRLPYQISHSWAESISTDGGDLAASGDSDWTLCYNNQLFKV